MRKRKKNVNKPPHAVDVGKAAASCNDPFDSEMKLALKKSQCEANIERRRSPRLKEQEFRENAKRLERKNKEHPIDLTTSPNNLPRVASPSWFVPDNPASYAAASLEGTTYSEWLYSCDRMRAMHRHIFDVHTLVTYLWATKRIEEQTPPADITPAKRMRVEARSEVVGILRGLHRALNRLLGHRLEEPE